jgi:hypothetical protein
MIALPFLKPAQAPAERYFGQGLHASSEQERSPATGGWLIIGKGGENHRRNGILVFFFTLSSDDQHANIT